MILKIIGVILFFAVAVCAVIGLATIAIIFGFFPAELDEIEKQDKETE